VDFYGGYTDKKYRRAAVSQASIERIVQAISGWGTYLQGDNSTFSAFVCPDSWMYFQNGFFEL
jgi:hypothetical protein